MQIPEFLNRGLLATALTHRSALNERVSRAKESNERLEYLGDAVLELVVSDFLYQQMANAGEGKLTALRSSLVKTTTLSEVGRELGLGELLYLSRGEESGGGRENETLLADTLEAVIGALYLDQGLPVAKKFIEEAILVRFQEIVAKKLYKDGKSTLQEIVQSSGLPAPRYEVVREAGPDHDKYFTVEVKVGETVYAQGEGKSKQTAQQQAAVAALARIERHEINLGKDMV
jgi:ribonuclease-3